MIVPELGTPVKADRDNNGRYETVEHFDTTVDASNPLNKTPVYDSSGNLTYDGVFRYAYDACM